MMEMCQGQNSLNFSESIDFLNTIKNMGISRFDCGQILSNGDWVPDETNSFCRLQEGHIHETVSDWFRENVYNENPIKFAMRYYQSSPQFAKQNDKFYNISPDFGYCILHFPFSVDDDYLLKTETDNLELVSIDSAQDANVTIDFNLDEESSTTANSDDYEMFMHYQQIFTNLIGKTYNDYAKSDVVKYVTVFLICVRNHDKIDFSNFVIVFSNKADFLKKEDSSYNGLKSIVHTMLQKKLFAYINEQSLKVKHESIKSAVSAIMTRNMSHNLGSHYLYYTKTHLDNLARRGGNIGPDIRGAARVMEYMQGRMDYLATIVSMDRYPYGCVNFKSQIYDVLTIDNFSKRHFKSSGNNVSRTVRHDVDVLLEEMRSVGKIDRSHLERMHKLTQDALDDNKNKRTTNFLLTNLILSEGFTRSDITIDDVQNDVKTINIHVRYNDQLFTGQADKEEEESGIKEQLTKLNIAMPGGVMSCHAFFNIIENFIRNSAKYLQADFKEEGLTVTIKIEEKEGVKDRYYFTIYDNKQNANKPLEDTPGTTLIESIKNRLGSLQILDDNNAVEKSNKGFKEMLFSAIWMQSYIYSNKQGQGNLGSYADVLNAIHSATTGDEKLKLITEYAFSIVAVDDNGNECGEDAKRNLGLRFALPKYQNNIVLNISGDKNSINTDINSLLNVYGDIAYVEMDKLNPFIDNLKERYDKIDCIDSHLIIPRMINEKPENDIDALKQVLYKRFGEEEFNKYKLHFGTGEDKEYYQAEDEYKIYFQQHLSSKDGGMSSYCKYAYADSVSGGNFTLTLSEIASRWDGNDNYEILKIKESALTRITLIDERLYDKMKRQGAETELSCKNIRVLNYKEPESQADESIMKLFIGNKFNRGGDATHFLSIHLGLVEKIIKDSTFFNSMTDENGEKYSAKSLEARTTALMRLLKECFGPKVFISVHSGRGNFSAELEGPLSVYPFISMAAIENTYDNSKYLLCQLFYSTIYLGKGVANKES